MTEERDLRQSYDKSLNTIEKGKSRDNTDATKNFDCTTISNPLLTVSWSYNGYQTGMIKQFNGIPTCQLTAWVM